MKVDVIFRAEGQLASVVGEAEADSWPEMKAELATLLRRLADEFEPAPDDEEVSDAAADG